MSRGSAHAWHLTQVWESEISRAYDIKVYIQMLSSVRQATWLFRGKGGKAMEEAVGEESSRPRAA